MKYWKDIISRPEAYALNEDLSPNAEPSTIKRKRKHSSNKYYMTKEPYTQVYFTQREVECLYYLVRGLTITSAASFLDLSPRTVEYYLKNMKMKVNVRTKADLIELLHKVGFVNTLDSVFADKA